MLQFGVACLVIGALAVTVLRARRLVWYGQARRRLREAMPAASAPGGPMPSMGALARWLYLAGFRGAGAARWFVVWTVLGMLVGGLAVWAFPSSQSYAMAAVALDRLPGGLGALFLPIWHAGPWLVAVLCAAAPSLVVRRCRRQRVTQVERDLPVALELLATLAESGLGFDAALAALQRALVRGRALAAELRAFQADLVAGRGRVQSLRRLAWRLDVPAVTVVVSALVQAEQVGASIAQTLRHQSEDLRNRRRSLALERSMALPVKLMFPLVVCFLPGLFAFTLGPAYAQFFQYADALIQLREFPVEAGRELPE